MKRWSKTRRTRCRWKVNQICSIYETVRGFTLTVILLKEKGEWRGLQALSPPHVCVEAVALPNTVLWSKTHLMYSVTYILGSFLNNFTLYLSMSFPALRYLGNEGHFLVKRIEHFFSLYNRYPWWTGLTRPDLNRPGKDALSRLFLKQLKIRVEVLIYFKNQLRIRLLARLLKRLWNCIVSRDSRFLHFFSHNMVFNLWKNF